MSKEDLKSSNLNQRNRIYQLPKEAGTFEEPGHWECGLGVGLRQVREGWKWD